MENRITQYLEVLPLLDKDFPLAFGRVILVKLRLEDICIRQWLSAVIQCREDSQSGVLGFCFDREQNTVVHDPNRKEGKPVWVSIQKVYDLLLKKAVIIGVAALFAIRHGSCFQDIQKFALFLIGGDF